LRGKKLFDETIAEVQQKKGRSIDFHNSRNSALVDRFYFYSIFSELRYEAILERLSSEFYISPSTIVGLLNDRYEQVTVNKSNQVSVNQLKKKHPHLIWELAKLML
jgi:hypothetical protein